MSAEPLSPFLTDDPSVPFFPVPIEADVKADLVTMSVRVPSAVKAFFVEAARAEHTSVPLLHRRTLAVIAGVALPDVLLTGRRARAQVNRAAGQRARRRKKGDKRTRPERVAAELAEITAEIAAEQTAMSEGDQPSSP